MFSYMNELYWREPIWLLIALQPALIFLLKKISQRNNLALYADKQLQPWVLFPEHQNLSKHIFSKSSAYILAWILFAIALAGPRTPLSQIDKERFFGADIMIVVDLSPSMQAQDTTLNRLQKVKTEIYDLLDTAKNHRIGITVFSARPHLLAPITSDHAALKTYINSIDKLTFPTLGSQAIDAILFAQNELSKSKEKSVIVMLTDGDFDQVSDNKINKLKEHNIPVYILSVGTPEGEAIPLKDGTWLKHEGKHVISKMNNNAISMLSNKLNGFYDISYDDRNSWDNIYHNGIIKHNTVVKTHDEDKIIWNEMFPNFLLVSILLFFVALIPYRINVNKQHVVPLLATFLIFSLPKENVHAFDLTPTSEQQSYNLYMKGDYANAEKGYKSIGNKNLYLSHFGQANSLYKMGHYQEAVQQYIFATLNAKNDAQRAKSLYNLANSYFRRGNFSLAINTYNDVLSYQVNDKASLYNIKISKVLRNNVELRLKENERLLALAKQGRGPRSANISSNVDINENTSVSIGESQNKLNVSIPLPDLPNLDKDTIRALITSGLNNIKLANNSANASTNNNKTLEDFDSAQTQQHLNQISDIQHLLWKRLFEIEEGFPAPVEKPHKIPSIKPW